jgi:predicted HicB family RNase H-like nuclease
MSRPSKHTLSRKLPRKRENLGHTMALNIRGMPAELVRKARVLAAQEDISLKDLVIRAIEQEVEKPV